MTLAGYAIDTYIQLTQIDVTSYKDKTLYFVIEKQNWYYLDKTDNNTWKPCTIAELNSLVNAKETFYAQNPNNPGLYNLIVSVRRQSDEHPPFQLIDRLVMDQLPELVGQKFNEINDYITTLFNIGDDFNGRFIEVNSRISNIENVTGTEIITKSVNGANVSPDDGFPKLKIIAYTEPERQIFAISGFGIGRLSVIGGSTITYPNNPVALNFRADFIGQQWIDTTNKDLWIAMNNSDGYGWRKMILSPVIISNITYPREEG